MSRHAAIVGIGSHLPDTTLSNADLELMVDTSDEWIVTRTGIRERRLAADLATSDLAVSAGRAAMECAAMQPDEIDLLVVGTSSPDMLFPSSACVAQERLGMTCPALDVNAACTGFIYALHTGVTAIESGRASKVMVIGADALTKHIDFTDRVTCVLFGDGAGAVILSASEEPGIMSIVLGSDGSGSDFLKVPAGGSAAPCTDERIRDREHYVKMNGKEVFRFAVNVIPTATREALDESGLDVSDIRWLVPHQANQRITDTIHERLRIPHERVFSNVATVGNTSAASIPLALDELYTSGQLAPGDLVALVGFGAGLTWGATIVRWGMPRPKKVS